jgi:hypothetical protein
VVQKAQETAGRNPMKALALRAGRFIIPLGLSLLSMASAVSANPTESELCIGAARAASQQTGVPYSVLQAISLAETGRRLDGQFLPWPWAVNVDGTGIWFDTKEEALAHAVKEYGRGARNFDIGCFQINFRWHGQEFASIEEMFNPQKNAAYAARFLAELYEETGDWTKAAGAYHSRTPALAARYAERFAGFRSTFTTNGDTNSALAARIQDIPDIVLAARGAEVALRLPRENRFPLLRSGKADGLGSLVPLNNPIADGISPLFSRDVAR